MITEEILFSYGFEKEPVTSWCGNGQDYQLPPENGGSRTTQQDYTIKGLGENDFIVRIESWETKNSMTANLEFHYCRYHPKCNERVPCFAHTIDTLKMAFKLTTGKELTLNKTHESKRS